VSISPGVPTRILSRPEASDLAAPSAGVGILAATSPVTFKRTPAEGGGPTDMPVGGTAFFRDDLWEADYTITATADGDFWDSNITFPGGGVAQFGTVTWHQSFGGQSDCFVSGLTALCGSTVADVRDIVGIQCQASGTYTYRLNQNGGQVFSGSFTLKPTLPPGTVTNQLQTDFPNDQLDRVCRDAAGHTIRCPGTPDQVPQTIGRRGCALAAAAMLLGYWGTSVDPVTLNDFLVALGGGGFDLDGDLLWPGVLKRAAQDGHSFQFRVDTTATPADLRNLICKSGPQIVYVKNRQHFVVVTGLTGDEQDFTIADPAGKSQVLNDYGGFRSVREFEPVSQPSFEDVLLAMLESPGELVVTDPLGRRTGFDPARGTAFGEIPASSYDSAGLTDLLDDGTQVDRDPAAKELYVHQPVDGEYTVTVTGTGNGTYTLDLVGYDVQQQFSRFVAEDIPISVREVHQYALRFKSADMSGGALAMSGGFDGGGQRSDINHLLSYARPGASRTTLTAGTSTYSLLLFYDAAIDPTSFHADLNGAVVTGLFHPVPGGNEVVTLPLQAGRNVLKLIVTGSPGGHTGTDRDQLTFLVQ